MCCLPKYSVYGYNQTSALCMMIEVRAILAPLRCTTVEIISAPDSGHFVMMHWLHGKETWEQVIALFMSSYNQMYTCMLVVLCMPAYAVD